MGIIFKGLAGWWIVFLLSVASLAASSDLRLVEAVEKGDKEAVRFLLQQHADVNTPQADGSTALAWAVHRDDRETAEVLIRAGANVNAANDYGVTPLSLACADGNAAMVEKLLKAKADAKGALPSGETALMTCARTGSVEGVKSLLAHGADVNGKETRGGQTALMWAVAQKHSEVARILIERGADIHARSKGGFTPLLFAAQQGDLDSARILLAAGANVNDAAPEDGSALVVASASSHEAFAIFLLDKGADPNGADAYGVTALHYSVQRGLSPATGIEYNKSYRLPPPNMPELVKALLAHGASPNVQILKDFPVYSRSFIPPRMSMVGATPFLLAASAGDANDIMRILVANGADPLIAAKGNVTPLMAAAGVVRGLYDEFNEEQEKISLEAVQLMVELGADVNVANKDGRTALHGAAFLGANSIIQFLIAKGAKIDVKDKDGQTPWSIAAGVLPDDFMGDEDGVVAHKQSADLLLKLGAHPLERSTAPKKPKVRVRVQVP